ncbi:MAG: MFS transporter [Alphaproteobacteria bacterium]
MDKTIKKQNFFFLLLPIMLTYFAMGFVDLVGVASNYMKKDFELTDTVANIFPFMVFFWFLIFAVPTGVLMNKIGRKKTVLISLFLTLVSVIIPLVDYNLYLMVFSFSLLGIGNVLMQVSINPLLSNIVGNEKISSYMTFGQFVKACCSLAAPLIASFSAVHFGNWRILYLVFFVQGIIAFLTLLRQDIVREKEVSKNSDFKACFALLKNGMVFLCFMAVICHVGIDVGTNITAAKLLQEKTGITVDEAMKATMVYFLFRTFASFSGAFIIAKWSVKKFFTLSMMIVALGMILACFIKNEIALYICFALIGFGNANIFPISLAQAMKRLPSKENELSGLMVMGIFGGSVFPVIMGVVSDYFMTQVGAIVVLIGAVLYLLVFSRKIVD